MKKNNFSNRQLFLLVSLEEKDYSTSQELANILNISIRTVKNEISILRNKIDSDLIFIQSTPGYGYKIIVKDKLCFAIKKYIVLQRKVHNVATQYFPFNYSVFDKAFFNR